MISSHDYYESESECIILILQVQLLLFRLLCLMMTVSLNLSVYNIDFAGTTDSVQQNYHKCFLVSKIGAPVATSSSFTSARCHRHVATTESTGRGQPGEGVSTLAALDDNGTYTGHLFSQHAVRLVREHAKNYSDRPLFLYYAMHDTHAPVRTPNMRDPVMILTLC